MSATFSLIIPTYNRADFIRYAIESALKQEYLPQEIIVVDDGSTDDTKAVVEAINDPRIRYFYKKNEERAVARNFGIMHAISEYCTFLDSDDILYPNYFIEAKEMILKHGSVEVFHLGYEIVDTNRKPLKQYIKSSGSLNNDLFYGNRISCAGVFIRKDIALTNLFSTDPDLICTEDWELWLRLGAKYRWYYNSLVASALVEHHQRSVVKVDVVKLERRLSSLIRNLNSNKDFSIHCKGKLPIIKSHMLLYIALHILMSNNKKESLGYILRALKTHFFSCWKQRIFYGVIKKLIF